MGRTAEEYTMLARAHQRVEDILSQPFAYRAPEDAVQRLKDYVREHAVEKNVAPPDWTA
jgi:hypothetical protein